MIENVYVDDKPIGPCGSYNFKDVRENHTISANFVTTLFTITFDPNGGTVDIPTKNVNYNKKYGELPTAEKRAEIFIGWYTEREGGTLVTKDTFLLEREDKTVYAHYENLSLAVKQKYNLSKFFTEVKGVKKYKVVRMDGAKATVSKKGMLTAKKEGRVEIIPLIKEGKKYVEVKEASVFVNITKPRFTEKKLVMKVGKSMNIKTILTGLPSMNCNECVFYTATKKKPVIKIDTKSGLIIPMKKGSAKVSVTIKNNQGYKAKISIKVKVNS